MVESVSSLLGILDKVKSWCSGGLIGLLMAEKTSSIMCCKCEMILSCPKYHCQSCSQFFCGNCSQDCASSDANSSVDLETIAEGVVGIKSCKLCTGRVSQHKNGRKFTNKIYPYESPRKGTEPSSPCFSSDTLDGYSPHAGSKSSVASFSTHPSPVSVCCSPSRSNEDGDDFTDHLCSPSSEYCLDASDSETCSVSAKQNFYSFKSDNSSSLDSPSRINITSNRVGHSVQKEQQETPRFLKNGSFYESMAILRRPERGTEEPETSEDGADTSSIFQHQFEKSNKPLDFEHNGLLWFPPPPYDEDDDAENNFFAYDDEDDEFGESGSRFSSSDSLTSMYQVKDKSSLSPKEPIRAAVQGHFRALVLQLLEGEGIKLGKDNMYQDWADIVTTIAWQAANFVKPDTSKGGSMDPGAYVKVKCVASGSPSESMLVRGVVCTKNIKHKRMTSWRKNARLLILGGELEYQRVPNQLASFNTLLQQEKDHLKMVIAKIDAYRPNVLLVERSVSSYAQELLLAKDISLVLNIKRPLLERIARCTGALIAPSVDKISTTSLGHCELFHLEKISEEHEPSNQFHRKPTKTLMFFEGCPRRSGCTVLLRGLCREELKKVKRVIQYAVFAAYHLSLETSFLADEGASLPKLSVKPSVFLHERITTNNVTPVLPNSIDSMSYQDSPAMLDTEVGSVDPHLSIGMQGSTFQHENLNDNDSSILEESGLKHSVSHSQSENLESDAEINNPRPSTTVSISHQTRERSKESRGQNDLAETEQVDRSEASAEYYLSADSHQSILVSLSSCCVLNGNVCERSRLLRIRFYGCFDKPLGRYLQDDVFSQTSSCQSCKEPAEAHVKCYTHPQGNLTINVRRLPSVKLPGEREGKIWMWHRCLRCSHTDGVPPATHRIVMSDAAWGLSFGKFLELSFSNHAAAKRVASCGHSLQRDCLRFYGYGSMVAFFRYSPVNILSVHLPPGVLEFDGNAQHNWIRKEAAELLNKADSVYAEISGRLLSFEQASSRLENEVPDMTVLHDHIQELKDLLTKEMNDYNDLLRPAEGGTSEPGQAAVDILEQNRLRHALLVAMHFWDRRLWSLDSLLKKSSLYKDQENTMSSTRLKELEGECFKDGCLEHDDKQNMHINTKLREFPANAGQSKREEPRGSDDLMISVAKMHEEEDYIESNIPLERAPSAASILSDKIDSAWTGSDHPLPGKSYLPDVQQADGPELASFRRINPIDNPSFIRIKSPARVYSFDSAVRLQERIRKGLPPSSLHLSTLKSFHASGEYRDMLRDPVVGVQNTYSQMSFHDDKKINVVLNASPFISYASVLPEGARLMIPRGRLCDVSVLVYDNEPTSIISYALSSKEHEDWVNKANGSEGNWNAGYSNKETPLSSSFTVMRSSGSMDLDNIHYVSYGSEDASTSIGSLFGSPKNSPHLRISFEDEFSKAGGKVKFSVTCYFAKQFDALRKKCCSSDLDFIRSLSRCRRWNAQGGKSNVFFAKSYDERFIIKQVTKTELESFEEFAPEYFRYLTNSLDSRSPTLLAKVLGIYQVTVKHLKGGKETKMDLMIMENIFYKRTISRVYDLKGSERSRYNSDTTGTNSVLLDMNLLESLRTKPMFLGSREKRKLERAVWNDTSFLASVDVMDYSLLVGVDEERKELVLGIIDFMRQYTWDKHLETWVKASGILGGPKNASPTIISPKQYKKRFRKAMTTYFLTVPDQLSS